MTPDSILRDWFQKVWNEGDENSITRLAHPEAVIHGLAADSGEPVKGTAQFVPFFRAMRSAIPDLHIHVERTISEGAYTTGHCVVTGHHTGAGLQVGATNSAVRFEGMATLRIANGQIVEAWNFFDFLTFYRQLGIVTLRGV